MSVFLVTKVGDKVRPALSDVFEAHAEVDDAHVPGLWFLEKKMVSDQHPDPKTTAEGPVEKGRYDLLVGDVLPAVLEALGQRRHHVLVVFHQGFEYGGVLRHVVQIQKFREVVEDVEGSDV